MVSVKACERASEGVCCARFLNWLRGVEGVRVSGRWGSTVVELHKRDDKNICVQRGSFRFFKRSLRLE